MATSTSGNRLALRGLIGLAGLFLGLCAIFALIVTVGEGWQEHTQAGWPEAAARIQQCDVDRYSHSSRARNSWIIECRMSYVVGSEEILTKVRSRSIQSNSEGHWQYPSGQIGLMQEWVDTHPAGSPMAVHYNPADHKKAALVQTDMPYGGPRTPSNLRLLAFAAIGSFVLLTIAKLMLRKPIDTTPPA